jgi:predicted SAM-dependent methyltransferase
MIGVGSQIADDQNAPDLYLDLNADPIPLPDASCSVIRASHFLEHSLLDQIFGETHRLLRRGGTFHFIVPYANSPEGMFPGHTIFLTEAFFHGNPTFQRLFEIDREEYDASPLWDEVPQAIKAQMPFDIARRTMFGVCNQMKVWATPRK